MRLRFSVLLQAACLSPHYRSASFHEGKGLTLTCHVEYEMRGYSRSGGYPDSEYFNGVDDALNENRSETKPLC